MVETTKAMKPTAYLARSIYEAIGEVNFSLNYGIRLANHYWQKLYLAENEILSTGISNLFLLS